MLTTDDFFGMQSKILLISEQQVAARGIDLLKELPMRSLQRVLDGEIMNYKKWTLGG